MSTPKRPAPRRSSLAGASPVRPPAEQAPEPAPAEPTATAAPKPSAPTPQKKARAAAKAKRTPSAPASGASETVRLGVYLTPEEFTAAKAAYLAAWQLGGEADTFARWIASTLDEHARREPSERAAGTQPKGRADTRTGASRSFNIPSDTAARMREAITTDQAEGRWLSDSAWMGEAIAAAVEQTRTANGGTLPTPPPRLPNRLVR